MEEAGGVFGESAGEDTRVEFLKSEGGGGADGLQLFIGQGMIFGRESGEQRHV